MDPMSHSKKTLVKGTFGDCGGRNGRIRSFMNVRKKKTKKQRKRKKRKKKEKKKEMTALVPPNLYMYKNKLF